MHIQKAPVAIFIFNRPDNVSEVMKQVRLYKPDTLLIVADGPREGCPNEENLCAQARQVALQVDWDCKVMTNFSSSNLGSKNRLVSGINWVFSNVESAIILEDDCVPNQSFFKFTEEMLLRYQEVESVGMISGNNYLFEEVKVSQSFYFSRYAHIWGWATWRRAWKLNDPEMKNWSSLSAEDQTNWLSRKFFTKGEILHWANAFRQITDRALDAWDYQWAYTLFNNNLFSVVPNVNLIRNIGISPDATHTTKPNLESTADVSNLIFPLTYPQGEIQRLQEADNFESNLLYQRTVLGRLRRNAYTARRLKKQRH